MRPDVGRAGRLGRTVRGERRPSTGRGGFGVLASWAPGRELRRQRLRVDDGERRDRAGEAHVEPAQAGPLVGLGRGRCRPVRPPPRGRTPGPSPAPPGPGRAGRRRRPRRRASCTRARPRPARSPAASTSASGTTSPTEPGRGQRRRDAAATPPPSTSATAQHRQPARGRADRGRRREPRRDRRAAAGPAYAITSAGTRKPTVSSSTAAPGLAEVLERRPPTTWSTTAWCPGRGRRAASPSRSSTGGRSRAAASAERSCASSSTTCPTLPVRCSRSATSSTRTASAADHGARARLRGGRVPAEQRLLGLRRGCPAATSARQAASVSSRNTTLTGSSAGQSASTHARTGRLRATASCDPVVR